tara:strand:- start:7421 stop:8503 length:1083 start_codon:yes stop_codon:yes gene_type:complete
MSEPLVVIVTTTIQPPTLATKRFCRISDDNAWPFIVVGDTKTPHKLYEELEMKYPHFTYLHPDHQEANYMKLSDTIGWKTIQRRNVGFVYAYHTFPNATWIATIDDDNIPHDGWGDELTEDQDIWALNLGPAEVYDPLACARIEDRHTPSENRLNGPSSLWHRGFPLQHREDRYDQWFRARSDKTIEHTYNGLTGFDDNEDIGVYAPMWDGDPDIDAMCRITFEPDIRISIDGDRLGFYANTLAPFNSQNTFIKRKWIPYYAVLPHVGRMDDIWGGYHLQKVMRQLRGEAAKVVYGKPTVTQERNEQDLITNLEKEVIGYRHTLDFINEPLDDTLLLPDVDYIPENTKAFYKVYIDSFDV